MFSWLKVHVFKPLCYLRNICLSGKIKGESKDKVAERSWLKWLPDGSRGTPGPQRTGRDRRYQSMLMSLNCSVLTSNLQPCSALLPSLPSHSLLFLTFIHLQASSWCWEKVHHPWTASFVPCGFCFQPDRVLFMHSVGQVGKGVYLWELTDKNSEPSITLSLSYVFNTGSQHSP